MVAYQSGYVSTKNSTTTLLGSGETFTGDWENISAFPSVMSATKSDASGTLYMEFSDDRTQVTADSSLEYSVAANINEVHHLAVTRAYYRARYVNGSVAQTSFELQTIVGHQGLLSAPLNLTLGQDADAIAVRSIDSEIDIAESKRAGYKIVNKFGRNEDVDGAEDIWAGGGFYTGFPAGAAELVTVTSSSTDDTAEGSGARTVYIEGLDANGLEQSETVTLLGNSLVDSASTYTRVNRAYVLTSGSSNQAFNAGTITVAHKVTTANIFVVIPIGANQSQVAAYTVPAGKIGYLRKLVVTVARSTTTNAFGALWVRNSGASPRLLRIFSCSQTNSITDEIYGGLVLPALTDIAVRITSVSATNADISANFDLLVVDS